MVRVDKIKMQVSVRKTSKGTSIPLWKHDFYAVYKTKGKYNGAKDVDIYQALEFRVGSEMPLECRNGLSVKQLSEIWVQGVYYAPAADVRRSNPELRRDRFIFQKDNVDEWEPCPQYKAALGKCRELVKVENCLSWNPMSEVLNMLPRVVHPIEWTQLALSVRRYRKRSRHNQGEERNFFAVVVTSKALLYVSRGKVRGPHQLTFLAMG